MLDRDFNELFRVGRMSLLVGAAVLGFGRQPGDRKLAAGTYLCRLMGEFGHPGWVANWRPIEIFLYDWWPLWRRRHRYRRLAAATVTINPNGA